MYARDKEPKKEARIATTSCSLFKCNNVHYLHVSALPVCNTEEDILSPLKPNCRVKARGPHARDAWERRAHRQDMHRWHRTKILLHLNLYIYTHTHTEESI